MSSKKGSIFSATALIVGTSIGAGIFAIPYAVNKVGFWYGLIYLAVLSFFVIILTLCYSEVVLRTKERAYFPGYAGKYLGRWGKGFGVFSSMISIYGALLAYTVAVGHFLFLLLSPFWGGREIFYSLIFFAICSLVIFFEIKFVARIDRVIVIFLIFAILLVVIASFTHFNYQNLLSTTASSYKDYFLPYGVILFALGALSAIPEVEVLLRENKKKFKKVIIIGLAIPIVIYFLFVLSVVGLTGASTTEEAISGVGNTLGSIFFDIGAVVGILAMTTSFLSLGIVLKDTFKYDFKLKKSLAWTLVVLVPLVLFLLNLVSFSEILGIVGTVLGGIEGVLIILMYLKAKKLGDVKPAYEFKVPKAILCLMALVFILGIVYQLIMIF